MTPHLTEDQLNGYADGSLAASERDAVESHLAACVTCRAEADELRALLAAARELPRAIEPERDLWGGIEGRIRAGAGSREPGAGRSG